MQDQVDIPLALWQRTGVLQAGKEKGRRLQCVETRRRGVRCCRCGEACCCAQQFRVAGKPGIGEQAGGAGEAEVGGDACQRVPGADLVGDVIDCISTGDQCALGIVQRYHFGRNAKGDANLRSRRSVTQLRVQIVIEVQQFLCRR